MCFGTLMSEICLLHQNLDESAFRLPLAAKESDAPNLAGAMRRLVALATPQMFFLLLVLHPPPRPPHPSPPANCEFGVDRLCTASPADEACCSAALVCHGMLTRSRDRESRWRAEARLNHSQTRALLANFNSLRPENNIIIEVAIISSNSSSYQSHMDNYHYNIQCYSQKSLRCWYTTTTTTVFPQRVRALGF